MEDTTVKTPPKEREDALALMYPGNQLKDQVRDYEDTFSPFKVLEQTFFER